MSDQNLALLNALRVIFPHDNGMIDDCRQRFHIEWPTGDTDTRLHFDRGHLERILTNLCQNALSHGNGRNGRAIILRIRHNGDNNLCIDVIDQGKGIAEEQIDKIFEPFYTTSHQGSGLGLYIVAQLAEMNNARVTAGNETGHGARFTLCKHEPVP